MDLDVPADLTLASPSFQKLQLSALHDFTLFILRFGIVLLPLLVNIIKMTLYVLYCIHYRL